VCEQKQGECAVNIRVARVVPGLPRVSIARNYTIVDWNSVDGESPLSEAYKAQKRRMIP
jgi:hypothetical protein